MDAAALFRHPGVDPAHLDRAPPVTAYRDSGPRIGLTDAPPKPCSICGQPAGATKVYDVPEYGRRWLDRCHPCFRDTVRLG